MRDFDRGRIVSKPAALRSLGLALSEEQNPQIVEKPENGYERREASETVAVLVRQAL